MLKGKNILIGITGGIAAYKAAILVREFVKQGCQVRVVMTPSAKKFITPLTMATLSTNPILVDFFNPENGEWNSHVKLGMWADAFVIAPATANTMAKMATGVADNLLVTTYLSARCPVFVATAMDLDMYNHPSTSRNIKTLSADGVVIIEPESGFLASGLEGKGRMQEPDIIVQEVDKYLSAKDSGCQLNGCRVVISAGGTVEPIDAVRYISNYSSGKMGYAIAKAAALCGAEVTIVRASVDKNLIGSLKNIGVKEVEAMSAQDMFNVMQNMQKDCNIIIMSAAVADYTPVVKYDYKIKKEDTVNNLSIHLQETQDIAAMLGKNKIENQLLIGFALETSNEENNASEKLRKKNLDFIVLNSLQDQGAGFAYDTNKITIIDKDGTKQYFDLKDKELVAQDIIDKIVSITRGTI